jgi:hypothetical protein
VKVDGHYPNLTALLPSAFVLRTTDVASNSYHPVATVVVKTLSGELFVFKIVPYKRTSFV